MINDPYIVPLFLNGQKVSALRDTGNAGLVLVDKRWVPPEAYIPNTFVYCKGVFDKDIKRKIPLAEVKIRSPRFQFSRDVLVRVGVCELPHGIDCNVGNELFQTHPELTDIIAFRRDMDTTTGIPEMQNRGEPIMSYDCDTNSHDDGTTAVQTDDTAQMITRSMTAQGLTQRDQALDTDHSDSDTDDLNRATPDRQQQNSAASGASKERADNDLNKTLSDFGRIDVSDLSDLNDDRFTAGRDPDT